MLELTRTVRFCLYDGAAALPRNNGYSAWPPPRGLAPYFEVVVACAGRADPTTGYFINVKDVDRAVRDRVLPYLVDQAASGQGADLPLGSVLRRVLELVQEPLGGVVAWVRLNLSPHCSCEIGRDDMGTILLRQRYEFSAAHRLHSAGLSAAENARIFGKCNNPSGHGHNYRLEVAVRCPIDAAGRGVDVAALDALVDAAVLQPLDHKHLNVDVPQFQGRNPSVENIAQVVFELLRTPTERTGLTLEEVRVWETEKTCCTVRRGG